MRCGPFIQTSALIHFGSISEMPSRATRGLELTTCFSVLHQTIGSPQRGSIAMFAGGKKQAITRRSG